MLKEIKALGIISKKIKMEKNCNIFKVLSKINTCKYNDDQDVLTVIKIYDIFVEQEQYNEK